MLRVTFSKLRLLQSLMTTLLPYRNALSQSFFLLKTTDSSRLFDRPRSRLSGSTSGT